MTRVCLLTSVCCLWLVSAQSTSQDVCGTGETTMSDAPVSFTPNAGQWPDSIKFRAAAGGATMWFSQGGVYYQFSRITNPTRTSANLAEIGLPDSGRVETMFIKASYVGANPEPATVGIEETGGRSHFYLGNDPAHWRTNVPGYRSVLYQNIYPGIDLKYYGDGRQMEYDFVVSPGADLTDIRVEYEGAKSISVNDVGELVVETDWGVVTERAPVVYQEINGERQEIRGEYALVSESTFGFNLGQEYDPAHAVVVDPKLVYSSYFGGSGEEDSYTIDTDDSGYVYWAGTTTSADFPTHNGYDEALGGTRDFTITKLTSDLQTIVYSTYLGGGGDETGCALGVDTQGNVFIAGDTRSTDFPVKNAYDGDSNGLEDWCLTKFNRVGELLFSTYFGGTGEEANIRMTVDRLGCPYFGGSTQSANLPVANAIDPSFNGGSDMFLAKFSPDGQSLMYDTYLGGPNWDALQGVRVDSNLCAHAIVLTASSGFPTTAGSYDRTYNGNYDCAVIKIATDGSSLVYSTFVGGGQLEIPYGLFVDRFGHAYVCGGTSSSDFPTINAFDNTINSAPLVGDVADGFFCKLSQGGDSLEFSTFFGGNARDNVTQVVVDDSGRVIAGGHTESTNFPTKYAYDSTFNGAFDAALVILSKTGKELEYSTYLGGTAFEGIWPVAMDREGSIYLAGSTSSNNFPTLNPIQGALSGPGDRFIVKFGCDMDSDGLCDVIDNCPAAANADQADTDGDGLGDACDNCTDTDGDGAGNPGYTANTCVVDNCPTVANPGQQDANHDGIGDACCCLALTGNIDCDALDGVDISDLSALIDNLYISLAPLCCPKEANVDGSLDGNIDISDLSGLIDFLYISFTQPSNCL